MTYSETALSPVSVVSSKWKSLSLSRRDTSPSFYGWNAEWVKKNYANVQISAEPGIEPGTLRLEGRGLTNYAFHAAKLNE